MYSAAPAAFSGQTGAYLCSYLYQHCVTSAALLVICLTARARYFSTVLDDRTSHPVVYSLAKGQILLNSLRRPHTTPHGTSAANEQLYVNPSASLSTKSRTCD